MSKRQKQPGCHRRGCPVESFLHSLWCAPRSPQHGQREPTRQVVLRLKGGHGESYAHHDTRAAAVRRHEHPLSEGRPAQRGDPLWAAHESDAIWCHHPRQRGRRRRRQLQPGSCRHRDKEAQAHIARAESFKTYTKGGKGKSKGKGEKRPSVATNAAARERAARRPLPTTKPDDVKLTAVKDPPPSNDDDGEGKPPAGCGVISDPPAASAGCTSTPPPTLPTGRMLRLGRPRGKSLKVLHPPNECTSAWPFEDNYITS